MIEALKHQDIVDKVGGKFKLSALIQKRMKEILEGSRPLIDDTKGKTLMEIVVQEILEDKITLEQAAPKETTIDPFAAF
ncbi:RNA polymerase Rpb6 [Limihaloglobus sulfuriphilus]|uniref:DNA-directed RNA polymerase subunit omega n=1 Tax=Limihaloglobus sulfuriphilus TaxID=1851148 RepID=A0A1Q2MBU2_9BACT|nr:DNA-directed RNA polymerase subunit omega [Limihaloglobus sulfuriphilus]AQQ70151.1 RNA polymerase Rpb6 [Limihaloglobus sulfuriphilus]